MNIQLDHVRLPTGHDSAAQRPALQHGAQAPATSSVTAAGSGLPLAGGWSGSVRGTEPNRDFDRQMADIAEVTYFPDKQPAGGIWTRLGDGEVAALGIDPSLQYRDGLIAGLYTDGQGHYVVGYAGFMGPEDLLQLAGQVVGVRTPQEVAAMELSDQVTQKLGADNVVYTSHSLGGPLAQIAAARSGSTAISFNGAGVNDNSLRFYGLDPGAVKRQADQGQMRACGVQGEYATSLQEDVPFIRDLLPDPLGVGLRMTNTAPPGQDNWLASHYMPYVKDSFDSGLPIWHS